jgi:hypothetical protein
MGFPIQRKEISMSKVINFFQAKRELENKEEDEVPQEEQLSFEEIIKKNERNKERIRKERSQANRSTLRSYRIKH